MKLKDLIEGLDVKLEPAGGGGGGDVEVRGIACDSREVGEGFLFVALKGTDSDGAAYAADAVKRGASVVLSENKVDAGVQAVVTKDVRGSLAAVSARFYGEPSKRLEHLAGVTGTNGKTTVCYLLESIFTAAGYNSGVMGTISYRYGGVSVPAPLTTPGAPQLQKTLREMADAGVTHVALEVSSHAIAQKRADYCRFTVKVFTNLTREHLDYHGTMEEYFEAKSRLFTAPEFEGKAVINGAAAAVINIDDEWGRRLYEMVAERNGGGVLRYSLAGRSKEADIFPVHFSFTEDGIEVVLSTPAGELKLRSPLVGEYNLYNIMAAAGAAIAMGIGTDDIKEGVAKLKNVPGRLELVESGSGIRAYVDYAHTPDALDRSLGALKAVSAGRLITVFGCGGDRDVSKRAPMGEAVARLSDITVVTSDNPRSEDPAAIIDDIKEGLKDYKEFGPGDEPTEGGYTVEVDRGEAIGRAVAMARSGDTLLVAGKGHESYQVIGDEWLPFDDREVLRGLLQRAAAS